MRPLDEYRNLPRPGAPGPWGVRGIGHVHSEDGWLVAEAWPSSRGEPEDVNATFIAAAPFTRAAVDELADEVEEARTLIRWLAETDFDRDYDVAIRDAQNRARLIVDRRRAT